MESIKKLIKIIKNNSAKTVFKAVLAYELGDFDYNYTDEEDKFLNKVYEEYINNKTISGLLSDDILQIIEEIKEMKD